MGGMLEVSCRECGVTSNQIDGPTMSGFNPRCERCGRSRHVSIMALLDTDPPGIEPASSEAWRLRHARIPEVAGSCTCGGRFSEDAPIRCPQCRTTEVDSVSMGIAD
jgi:hypothetical protein